MKKGQSVIIQAIKEQYNRMTKETPISSLLSEGNRYLRLLRLEKAITTFDKALEQDPNHFQTLLSRGKCYMKLGKYEEALKDFDGTTRLKPECIEAIHLKGVTQYLIGDIEKGFLTYLHGYEQPTAVRDKLRQGFQFCQKSMDDCLDAEKRMLLTGKDVNEVNKLFAKGDVDSTTNYNKEGLYSPELKLLEDISSDKKLAYLHPLCRDLIGYLRNRQNFWETQKPCTGTGKSGSMLYVKNNVGDILQMKRLICNFKICKSALNEGKTAVSRKKGSDVLVLLNSISRNFPEKNEMEAETLHCLVMAYLVEENFTTAMKYCKQQLSTVNKHAMQEAKERVYRDFGEIYYKTNKYKEALRFFMESLVFVKQDEEKVVLLYRISDCNVHLNKLEDANIAAQYCLDLVCKSEDLRFQFDALLLLAEIAVKGRDMKVAEEHYRKALEVAIGNNDARQYDLELLLEIFKEVAAKDSYSQERIKMVKITENIKHP